MSGTRASNDRPLGTGGVKRGRLQQEAAANGSRVTVVLGAQWGDEGKGKVVDLLATDADIISRCQVRAGRGGASRGGGGASLPPHPPSESPPPGPSGPCFPGLRALTWEASRTPPLPPLPPPPSPTLQGRQGPGAEL